MRGRVKFWKSEKGWGAISSDELPPGQDAFAHFSRVDREGFRDLEAGEPVEFDAVPTVQDSFRWTADRVRPLEHGES